MPNVVHVEIRADVPQRAVQFYSAVFGWDARKRPGQGEQFVIHEQPGSGGVKMTVGKRTNRDSVVPRFEVSSINDAIKKIYQSGGKVVAKRKEIPRIGSLAYCHDSEGNTFSIFERLPRKQ
jgi:uncharacterized protein